MKLKEIIEKLNLELKSNAEALDADVQHAHAGDMLSYVMANATGGSLWITVQTHNNIVAVATLKSFAGIIIIGGRQPDVDTVRKANEERIPILSTTLSAFEIAGRLYELGIRP